MARISRLGKDGDLKFGQKISNRYSLKLVKFQNIRYVVLKLFKRNQQWGRSTPPHEQ